MPTRNHLMAYARAVRHEANNLLAAMSGTADLLLRAPAATERDIARAERLRDAATRLHGLLYAYLALGAPTSTGTPIGSILETIRPLFALTLGPGRKAVISVAPDLPPLAASVTEIQALVLDLAREAAQGARPDQSLHVAVDPVPGGVHLSAWLAPGGAGADPVFLPAASP